MNEPAPQALATTEAPRPKPSNFGSGVIPLIPQDFESAWRYGAMILKGGLAPKGMDSEEKVVAAILVGAELGLSPINALQNIAVINGRPAVWGDAQLGIVQASGLIEDFEESFEGEPFTDDFKAVCRAKRQGRPTEIVRSYSVAEAKIAGLWEKRGKYGDPTPWVTNPKRMLQMRARSLTLRDGFADVLKGLYSREELIGEPMVDVTPAGSVASAAELNQMYLTEDKADPAPAAAPAPDPVTPAQPAAQQTPAPALPKPPVAPEPAKVEDVPDDEPTLIGEAANYATMTKTQLATCARQALETLNEYEPEDGPGRLGFWASINGAALMLALGRKALTAEKSRLEAAVPQAA